MLFQNLSSLKEDDLRKKVVIPLFRAMGFQDVFDYHGGGQEQGKDVVMWKKDLMGVRVNYGVVLKALKISGSVDGKSSASKTSFQIQQCYGDPYLDPITSENCSVRECWVVSSNEISKGAIKSITSALSKTNLEKSTRFIDGNKLRELINEYLPTKRIWEKLIDIQKDLDSIHPSYRLVPKIFDDRIEMNLLSKTPENQNATPITFKGQLQFPKTPEGIAMQEAFQNHLKTGEAVSIPADYIGGFAFDGPLEDLFELREMKMQKLDIGPSKNPRVLTVNLIIQDPQGGNAKISNIQLKMEKGGTEEITFSNEEQQTAWKIRCVLNFKSGRMETKYTMLLEDVNVKEVLEGLRFLSSFAKGGNLIIENSSTGIEIGATKIEPKPNLAANPKYIQLLEKLFFVQQTLKTPFSLPKGPMHPETIFKIHQVAEILQTGKTSNRLKDWRIEVENECAQKVLERFSVDDNPKVFTKNSENEPMELLGSTLFLGKAEMKCEKSNIEKSEMERIRNFLKNDPPEKSIKIKFVPVDNCPMEVKYLDWLPLTGDLPK
jgi:hypothetical protein